MDETMMEKTAISDDELAETIAKVRGLCNAAKDLTQSPIAAVQSLAVQVLASSRLMLLEVAPGEFEPISTCEKFPDCLTCGQSADCLPLRSGGAHE